MVFNVYMTNYEVRSQGETIAASDDLDLVQSIARMQARLSPGRQFSVCQIVDGSAATLEAERAGHAAGCRVELCGGECQIG